MKLEKLNPAVLSWSEQGYPSNQQFQDKYFSAKGLEESKYVFIDGNQLESRMQQWAAPLYNILETGFGTGLNFLVTLQLWKQLIDMNYMQETTLQYFSIENSPISKIELDKIHRLWPQLEKESKQLLQRLPEPIPGRHLLKFSYKDHQLNLYLLYQDAEIAISELVEESKLRLDSFFLDGFSPKKNQTIWSDSIFKKLALLSADNSSLATYTASSTVARRLKNHGFVVKKLKGFSTKREMITASFSKASSTLPAKPAKLLAGKKYAVIGAGLAGCITASKLAENGADVSLIDAAKSICNGASGNEMGLSYPRLSNGYDSGCAIHLCSHHFLQTELLSLDNVNFQFNGIQFLLDDPEHNTRLNQNTSKLLALSKDYIEYFSQQNPSRNFLEFKSCGWINPTSLAAAYLAKAERAKPIRYFFNTPVENIVANNSQWKLSSNHGTIDSNFDAVIYCGGFKSIDLLSQYQQYTKPVRGQIDLFQAPASVKVMTQSICGSKYIIPFSKQQFWVGASFEVNQNHSKYSASVSNEHQHYLAQHLGLLTEDLSRIRSRVGVRLCSNDRLPLVGAVAEKKLYCNQYQKSLRKANATIQKSEITGLYMNTAHGSHGMTTIPLLTEHLVSTIIHQPSPLAQNLHSHIGPQRFFQRELKKLN